MKEALAASKLTMLAQMAPTSWGSIQAMAETMLDAEAVLHQLSLPANSSLEKSEPEGGAIGCTRHCHCR
jgi:hypothetical protein